MRIRGLAFVLCLGIAACGQPEGSSSAAGGGQAADPPGEGIRIGVDRTHAGLAAPTLPLETGPDGATETIADIVRAAGTPVLVNLWATWCTPCLKELPTLDRLAADTTGALKVVPVSQDMEGWRVVEPAFTAERYPHMQTRLESQMAFGAELGLRGLPVTILYDREGREVWRYNGDRDWSDAEARALIAEADRQAG